MSSEEELNYSDEEESEESDSELENESDTDSADSENSSVFDLAAARQWHEVRLENLPPIPPRFPFRGTPGVEVVFDPDASILQYFENFFNDEIVNIICTETNRYASEYIRTHRKAKPFAHLSCSELKVFLGLVILQGVVKKPEMEQYWSKNPMLMTPFFLQAMSFRRFKQIKQFLHFSNNAEYNPQTHPYPKLNKIWPILEKLNCLFKNSLTPDRDVTIDESLLLFKGRLSWMQYIPLKRARFGIKSYMLCESKSGYLWSMIVYTGRGTICNVDGQQLACSTKIVLSLMEELLGKGYCLTVDNFYTSPELADILISQHTDVYGTVKLNRKEIPNELKKKELKKRKMKKGDIVGFQRGKVTVMAWKDKKTVSLLSTIHTVKMVEIEKRGEKIIRPECVVAYNDTMGGVDKVDQHLVDYSTPRKRGKKYYKKIFFHLLDLALWNSYILYNKSGGTLSNLLYRLSVVEKIMESHHSEEMKPKHGRPSSTMNPLRLTERHFLDYIPATGKKANPTRQCAVCCRVRDANGKKIRRESRFYCPDCDVALCVAPCFRVYHTVANI